MASASGKHVLLTGPPGVGKTTLVQQICDHLVSNNVKFKGFYTTEKRERADGGKRIGFDVVPVPSGPASPLSRLSDGNPQDRRPKVGQYAVDLTSFERTALSQLALDGSLIYIVDEIGKMELFSDNFKKAVMKLFDAKGVVILATIPIAKGRPIPFVENIRGREDCTLIHVSKENRDSLFTKIVALLT